jgi:hypothetical protein
MQQSVRDALQAHCSLYDKAEAVFKQSQQSANVLDVTVLNELRYGHRALITALGHLVANPNIELTEETFHEYFRDAQKGICIAINDAVDTVVIFAKNLIRELQEQYPNASIADAYGKDLYYNVIQALIELERRIAESREFRRDRVQKYEELAQSGMFKVVVTFTQHAPALNEEMKKVEGNAAKQLALVQQQLDNANEQNRLAVDSLATAKSSLRWTVAAAVLAVIGLGITWYKG